MSEKLHLRVELDEKSGFCFGVTNAVEKAEEALRAGSELYCIGEIVHNQEEVRRLKELGMITVSKDQINELHGKNILIRAHGEPPGTYKAVEVNSNSLIDASCPVVLKFQQRIRRSWQAGEKIYLFGKPGHAEIVGLNGQIGNEGVVFENIEDLDLVSVPLEITLYSQTTGSPGKFKDIIAALEATGKKVKVHDTICRQVSNRGPHLHEFCRKFDKIIFVAGEKSSNGKVLFEICLNANPDTFFVSSKEQLQSQWFLPGESVGICGATSTPAWQMQEVQNILTSW